MVRYVTINTLIKIEVKHCQIIMEEIKSFLVKIYIIGLAVEDKLSSRDNPRKAFFCQKMTAFNGTLCQ